MILAADNIRITNSIIQHAVNNMDSSPVKVLAQQLAAEGANAIDINTGPLSSCPEEKMEFLVNAIQEITDLTIILDTVNSRAIRAGLTASEHRVIINGFSLEPDRLNKILPLAAEFDVEIIGYLLDSKGLPPPGVQDRLNIAVELFQKCMESNIPENRLIIDPVVAPLLWNDGAARNMELLEILRMLPDVLGFQVKTMAGLSNLTSGIKDINKKTALRKIFLPMLSASGVSIVLMDMLDKSLIKTAKACDLITGKKPFSELEL